MLAVSTDYITAQSIATIVDRALGYPYSPQGWDGTGLNQAQDSIDSVWPPYRQGTSRQHEWIYYSSVSDCWYPLSDATIALVNASNRVSSGDKATIAAAAATRIDIGSNPYAGGRSPKCHFVGACVYWLGDSITQATETSDEHWGGMRGALKDYCIARGYRVDMVGPQAMGSLLRDNEHSGVGGNTCAMMNARVAAELGGYAGGILGWHLPRLACLYAGANDVRSGSNSTANYATLLTSLHNALVANQPTARISVSTLAPMNDFNVATFNSGLPAVWDAFDAAHPSNTLIRWDAFNAFGGAYNATYFYDNVHWNHAGYLLSVNHPSYGMAVRLDSYLAVIGAYP